MPTFNFKTGKKEYGNDYLQLGAEDILVIEGIHCLNDEMSYMLPKESKYKIYISALTQLNVDEHNRVATTDGRLIRRLVRDSVVRVLHVLSACGNLCARAKKKIFSHFRSMQMRCLIRQCHMNCLY